MGNIPYHRIYRHASRLPKSRTKNCMTSVISSYRLSKWMKIQGMYYWHPLLIIQTQEGRMLKRLREKSRRQGCKVMNVPDGYSGIIKTERCELPDGTVYSLTSHWVPQLPIRKQQHFSAQWERRSELDFSAQCNITMETEEVGSQTEDVRIVTRTTGSECDIISCRMY